MKKNRIIYLLMLIASSIFVYNRPGTVSSMIFYILILLPVISFSLLLISYSRFKFTQHIDSRLIVKGDTVTLTCTMHNEDIFVYPPMTIILTGEKILFKNQYSSPFFILFPNDHKSFSIKLKCNYRGSYRIGLEKVLLLDYLGLFKLNYNDIETLKINVFPQIVDIVNFPIETKKVSVTKRKKNILLKEQSSLSDIRPYQYGDTMNRIHWKLSTKHRELIVKKFESLNKNLTCMFLNLEQHPISYEKNIILEDKLIETLTSLIKYCLSRKIMMKLIYYNMDLHEISATSYEQFDSLYHQIGEIQFSNTVPVTDLMTLYLDDINNYNVFLFTTSLNENIMSKLLTWKINGSEIFLIYVTPYEYVSQNLKQEEEMISQLINSDIKVYKLNINSDIKSILEGAVYESSIS